MATEAKRKILFVEDIQQEADRLMAFFNRQFPDLEFVWVKSKNSALKMLGSERFGAVITDNVFPRRDNEYPQIDEGLHLIAEIRDGFAGLAPADMPVLLQTSERTAGLISKAQAKGVTDVIDKNDYRGYIGFMEKYKLVDPSPPAQPRSL